ncbi:HSP90 family protein [Sphingobacterium sp. Mn56C]|uniref:HSP90 family protein n=1 Tax=Sphingobacterium sp. Mn56C TaxID=3395261 RepID=UPI003BE7EA8D
MDEQPSYSFQVNLKGMIALLSEHLYSDPNTFIRELLQNAVDAITALRHIDENHVGQIAIHLPHGEQENFRFEDNGIGLKEADIHQFLSVIGESSKGKDINDAKDFIGKFGIGLLSCFVVSDQIIVETKSALEQKPLRWIANTEGDYSIQPMLEDMPIGTRVILKPKKVFNYLFEKSFFTAKLRFYGDAIKEQVMVHDGAITEVLNHGQPVWLTEKSDKAALLEVGKRVFNTSFLDAVPFDTEAGKTRGVLYILPFKTQFSSKQYHRVYLKRMFLSEEDQSLLPSWAFFVRMLINTEELSATASRESLMKNDLLRDTRKEIAKALKDYLRTIKAVDYSIYTRIIQTHFLHLKAFALEDNEFLDIFLDDMPFETNRGFRNFKHIAQAQQTIFYCAEFENFKQIDRLADTQGQLLVNASYTFDTELLKKINQRYRQYTIREMLPSQLMETFSDIGDLETERFKAFRVKAEAILLAHNCVLELKMFQPADTAAIYTKPEQSHLENTAKQLKENANPFAQVVKAHTPKTNNRPILCLNVSNDLIHSLAPIEDTYLLQSVIEVLYVQAMILGKYQVQESEMKVLNNAMKNLIVMGLTNFVNI